LDTHHCCDRLQGDGRLRVARGADDFAVEPFRPAELLARVKALVRVRHLENDIDRAPAYSSEPRRSLAATR
jgi:DNA-binding response OmpR family regulator